MTAAERPDLWEAARANEQFVSVWPEYNHHGNHSARYFGALYPQYADVQVLVVDRRTNEVVARGRTIPFRWDGTLEDLPSGIDATGLRAVREAASPGLSAARPDGQAARPEGQAARPEAQGAPDDLPAPGTLALAALAAEVAPSRQGHGLSSVVIAAMTVAARNRGLRRLAAPVRPSWKDRYPITPIAQYARWRRSDGLPFDPWMRVHARLGASVLRAEPRSMEITGPVEEWEAWTGMRFPEDGEYVFPAGLAPLAVEGGVGRYWEPNVWMLHEVPSG